MAYWIEKGMWQQIFAVPSQVVDNHIKLCGEVAIKVLLILLRYQQPLECEQLRRMLGEKTPLQDIEDAIIYWCQAGIIFNKSTEQKLEQGAELAANEQKDFAKTLDTDLDNPPPNTQAGWEIPAYVLSDRFKDTETEGHPPLLSYQKVESLSSFKPTLHYTSLQEKTPDDGVQKIQTLSSNRGRLSSQDINSMARADENIGFLLQEAQSIIGKPLNPVISDTVVCLYSYYGFAPDLVLMLLQYSITIGSDSMRYVEKVASTWIEKGIDSHEKAEQEILLAVSRKSDEGKIKSAFGIYDRKLVPSEQKYIQRWVDEYKFETEIITLAFERSVAMKGKLSFAYINGILANWHKKGVKTIDQAVLEIENKKPDQPIKKASANSRRASSYDLGEIENLITYQSVLDKKE